MKFTMIHENYNVADLDASLAFYKEALGLTEDRRRVTDSYTIAYVKNEMSDFEIELTCLNDHPQKYDLGECEFHLAVKVDDFDAAFELHKSMGCICYENKVKNVYFIEDPDGYWIEIVPAWKFENK